MVKTEIDILDDSVSDIMDKLFYKATDGKTIDYAWDAPQPAAVNPLSVTERLEWGDKAMSVQFNRVAKDPRRMGSRRVSSIAKYSQRTTAEPFFGYVSEPPKARVFRSEEPIGPVAKALKAAGTLAALAERNDEDPEPIWSLFTSIYGPIPNNVRDSVKPDLGRMSDKDMIKLIRSSNHGLYGFNANGPAVSVDTGKYKPETMPLSYQFDWHAMCLTMRFIGEMVARYSSLDVMAIGSIKFAPAYSEARMLNIPKFASGLSIVKREGSNVVQKTAVEEIASKTMKYYTGSLEAYGVRAMLRADARSISVKDDSAFTVDVVRDIASKLAKKPVALPKTVARYRPEEVVAEIVDASKPRFYETIIKSSTRAKSDYLPTWKSVSTAVWAAAFYSRFKNDDVLRSILRKQAQLPDMTSTETKELLRSIATSMPRSIGYTIFMVLKHMCPNHEAAIVEFATMIAKLSGVEHYVLNDSYDSMYTTAIVESVNPSAVISAIHRGFSQYQSKAHSFKAIQFRAAADNDCLTAMLDAMDRFVKDRMQYWSVHYESRVYDNRKMLKALKKAAQEAGLRGKDGVGPTMKLDDVETNNLFIVTEGDEERLSESITRAKKNIVKYSLLAMCFKNAKFTIDASFNVEVNLPIGAYRGIILRSADNYVRKRKTWGKTLAEAVVDWDEKREKVYTLTRHTDIARYVDSVLKPNILYFTIHQVTVEKLRVTQRMVTRMLKRFLLSPHDDTEEEEFLADLDEENAVTEFDEPTPLADVVDIKSEAKVKTGSMYDILAYSSDEEGNESGSSNASSLEASSRPEFYDESEDSTIGEKCERWTDTLKADTVIDDKPIVDTLPQEEPSFRAFGLYTGDELDKSFASLEIVSEAESDCAGRTRDDKFSFKDWLLANKPGAFRHDSFAAFLHEYFPEDNEELTADDVLGPLSGCERMYEAYTKVASRKSDKVTPDDLNDNLPNHIDIA